MRYTPKDKYDFDELKDLNAEQWQLDLLKLNPEYCSWGNFEDGMSKEGKYWDCRVDLERWSEFGFKQIDSFNECVNFYFELYRQSKPCTHCDSSGYNPATHRISEDFYDFNERGTRWVDKITQDEVEALQNNDRLRVHGRNGWVKKEGLTAEEVNEANRIGALTFSDFRHDSINRGILIRTRAERLGVWGYRDKCNGNGYVYTQEKANIGFQAWILHPRMGVSLGVYVKNILQSELPEVFAYLKTARERNNERFSKI